MSARRRAALLLALSALLGGLAAADVAGREAALRRAVGPVVPVVVARSALAPGEPIRASALGVRHVPRRFAPSGAFPSPRLLEGVEPAVAVAAGADVVAALVDQGMERAAPVGPGERVAEIVASGSVGTLEPGSRVDVLVTRERGDGEGETTLALQDAEVLAARGVQAGQDGAARVSLSLRVSVREAVYLAAAHSFARELRVLPRAPGDRARIAARARVDSRLRRP